MIIKILIALAIVVVTLVVIIAVQPSDFRVSRAATLPASPAEVFPHVNDLHKWQAWSPWARLDPNCRNTFEGPPAGPGASLAWAGNHEVGTGRMTITESQPNEFVRFRLDFVKPFEGKCDTEFTFRPEGAGTQVTWTMTGTNNFIGKAVSLVMNCDKMVGGQFEQGFANLRQILESNPSRETGPVVVPTTAKAL